MEFRNTVNILGNRLEEKYSSLGFKYKKDERVLEMESENFTYLVAFFSFGFKTSQRMDLDVCYIINRRPFDPRQSEDHQLLNHSLWNNEIFLDIANEEKLEEAYNIICKHMDEIMIPKIKELNDTKS